MPEFNDVMLPIFESMTDEEIEIVVEYLLTLR